jgi:hypothetical protein
VAGYETETQSGRRGDDGDRSDREVEPDRTAGTQHGPDGHGLARGHRQIAAVREPVA